MSRHTNGGVFNPAYHDSETLESDRRKTHHTNPYARGDLALPGDRVVFHPWHGPTSSDDAVGTRPWGGWQEEGGRRKESIPIGLQSMQPESPAWQHDFSNITMRWKGITITGMSMVPGTDAGHRGVSEDANEMEKEEQDLVQSLVALSTQERVCKIRELPKSFKEKKHIRSQVLVFKQPQQSRNYTCFADCSESVSLSMRRCDYSLRSVRQTMELWHSSMKEIGGRFGTGVLSYFVFLKWMLVFNIFSFLINFGFITIPLLIFDPSPYPHLKVRFRGLEILTGAGSFNYTIMYYGGYSNETLVGLVDYNMQLAYFLTIAVYLVLCGITLIFSMANSFKRNYELVDTTSSSTWQLLCSWDFRITNERAVRQQKNNLRVQLKELLSETDNRELLTLSEKLKHFGVYIGSWLLSTSLAVGCGAGIYYLCQFEQRRKMDPATWSFLQEAETLLVPFVASLMNLLAPQLYSFFNKFECYSSQRKEIYALIVRTVFLKMLILAVLCYNWTNVVAKTVLCWESMVGQALYRLVICDFIFLLLGCFFGEFLRNFIGTRCLPQMGVPEFDVARNVLELIYTQTLTWIGIYFSPLLPAIQILKFLMLFYLKKISLTHNCQPPQQMSKVARLQTTFIVLLFFPFFVGALCMVAYTAWRLTPSRQCGPFQGLDSTVSMVKAWTDDLDHISGCQWAIWIYDNIIRSEIFYFIGTLIILVVIHIYWQITKGRQQLIGLLRQQIVNERNNKSFLLEKLQDLQKSQRNKNQKQKNPQHARRGFDDTSRGQSNSNAMVKTLLGRQRLGEEERWSADEVLVPSDIPSSHAWIQTMTARQRVEEQDSYRMPGKHQFSFTQDSQATQMSQDHGWHEYHSTLVLSENSVSRSSTEIQAAQSRQRPVDDETVSAGDLPSAVLMQVMQVRQREVEQDRSQWSSPNPPNSTPLGSTGLIQAMLARQQAQNEFDDGY